MVLRHLRYFVALAEEQNVTGAAVRLHVSQPTLIHQILDLEDEHDIALANPWMGTNVTKGPHSSWARNQMGNPEQEPVKMMIRTTISYDIQSFEPSLCENTP